MMRSIRFRFFAWLGLQTVLVFLAIGLVLLVFNLHEQHEHPGLQGEEAQEALVVSMVMALLFPVALGSAWYISRKLLHPWQQLVSQAARIGTGHLDERIDLPETKDELGQLAEILNNAFDRYQHLLDRMHRFSFDASHQLRNPLAALRTSGEVCLAQPRSADEYQSVIGGMLEETQRLSRTVEQLLMLARAAQGELEEHRQVFPLIEVVADVVEDARAIGQSEGVRVTLQAGDSPWRVRGARELIRQALTNIMDNALRFSPSGGTIGVTVAQVNADRVRITVSDAGPGLSAERKAVLFRPFSRETGSRESVGLGLAIAADICRAHQGGIGVEDHPGGGSVFWMEFAVADREGG